MDKEFYIVGDSVRVLFENGSWTTVDEHYIEQYLSEYPSGERSDKIREAKAFLLEMKKKLAPFRDRQTYQIVSQVVEFQRDGWITEDGKTSFKLSRQNLVSSIFNIQNERELCKTENAYLSVLAERNFALIDLDNSLRLDVKDK